MPRAGKNIEVWMVELNLAMCAAVRDHMIRAVRAYPDTPRTQWSATQRPFPSISQLEVASTASARRHTTVTPSRRPRERLHIV